jgi:hypothetical protein
LLKKGFDGIAALFGIVESLVAHHKKTAAIARGDPRKIPPAVKSITIVKLLSCSLSPFCQSILKGRPQLGI